MTTTILTITATSGGALIGIIIQQIIQRSKAQNRIKKSEQQAKRIIKKAHQESDRIKKDKMLQAKERFIELKAEHEKVILNREKKINEIEKRAREKESTLNKELSKTKNTNDRLEQKSNNLDQRIQNLDRKRSELDKAEKRYQEQLEVISGFSAEQAKNELIASLEESARTDAMSFIQKSIEEAKLSAEQEAKKIIINTIQRIGTEEAVENCVSVFNIDSDDVKGELLVVKEEIFVLLKLLLELKLL